MSVPEAEPLHVTVPEPVPLTSIEPSAPLHTTGSLGVRVIVGIGLTLMVCVPDAISVQFTSVIFVIT